MNIALTSHMTRTVSRVGVDDDDDDNDNNIEGNNNNNNNNNNKGKDTVHPRTGHEGPEGEQMYSFTLPATSALDGDGWSTPRPVRFTRAPPPGKTRYPLYKVAGWAPGPVWTGSENLGFDPGTVQPVVSRYTD